MAAFVAITLLTSNSVLSEESPSLEYQVKAAFLIKFAMFVEWPPTSHVSTAKGKFVIGILGNDPFGASFDEAVNKKTVNGRQIEVRRAANVSDLIGCHLVFVSSTAMNQMADALSQLSSNGVLTVGDAPAFANNGGMIGFIKEDGKLRFEFNIAVAENSGLKISSKLLQVGKVVANVKRNHG